MGKRKGWFGYSKGEAEQQAEKAGDKAVETTANAVAAYLLIKVSTLLSAGHRANDQ